MTIIDLSAPEPKDSTPTSGSNLAITSGGVYSSVSALDTRITALEDLLDGDY